MRKSLKSLLCCSVAAAAIVAYGEPSGLSVGTPAHAAGVLKGDCGSLVNLQTSIDTVIENAEVVHASDSNPWEPPANALTGPQGPQKITVNFCRVTAYIKSSPKSHINVEVWLPTGDSKWNGKFYGSADGGSTGAIFYGAMSDPLKRGYASMGHDNGHVSKNSFENSWAFDAETKTVKQDLIVDFGYRAEHVATVVGKELTKAFYGADPKHSYYVGCSQGGHHGMMEVQRYPEDYDGIVAGSHGGDWLGMTTAEAYGALSIMKAAKLSGGQIIALHKAAIAACDAKDGLVDGMVQEPQKCDFDPASLQCGARDVAGDMCLSPDQVAAVKNVYAGPHNSKTGQPVGPGYAKGSENNWVGAASPMGSPNGGSFYDFFKLVVKHDPDFDLKQLNFDTDIPAARAQYSQIFDANDPDLSKFKARNGKLIMYHGWGDALISPYISVNYWEAAQKKMGEKSLSEFARLFMVPGMGHCVGGPVSDIDFMTALENWVEKGQAPDGDSPKNPVIGSGTVDGIARKRPICAFPTIEKYKGSGDINKAENFTCGKGA